MSFSLPQHTCGETGRASCAPCMAFDTALWEAIRNYAVATGGDPSSILQDDTASMQVIADAVARVMSRQAIDDIAIQELAKGGAAAAAAACKASGELRRLQADHAHLQRLYKESREYVDALGRERDALVEASRHSVAVQDKLDDEVRALRECLVSVRGLLRTIALRPELAGAGPLVFETTQDLLDEADTISSVLGERSEMP